MAALQRYYNHHHGHVYRIIDVTGSVTTTVMPSRRYFLPYALGLKLEISHMLSTGMLRF